MRTQPSRPGRRRGPAGFTLVEMLVVVALIGIVAALALPRYRNSQVRAKEAVLKHDLWILRDVIDQFFTDQGRYPNDLEELVTIGYLRKVPIDPLTESPDSWVLDYEALAEDDYDSPSGETQGVTDVSSGSPGQALDGSWYADW
jgi:general secretion pathway protein G